MKSKVNLKKNYNQRKKSLIKLYQSKNLMKNYYNLRLAFKKNINYEKKLIIIIYI